MVGGYLSGLLFSCSRQRNRKAAKKGRRKKSRTRRGASQVQKKKGRAVVRIPRVAEDP